MEKYLTGAFFLAVALLMVWAGFIKKQVSYPFSTKQMGIQEGRVMSAIVAFLFVFFAYLWFRH
jgi:hypothetical protein